MSSRGQYAVRLGVPPERTCVVPHRVDVSLLGAEDAKAARQELKVGDRPTVLFVGRFRNSGLSPQRGIHLLVPFEAADEKDRRRSPTFSSCALPLHPPPLTSSHPPDAGLHMCVRGGRRGGRRIAA